MPGLYEGWWNMKLNIEIDKELEELIPGYLNNRKNDVKQLEAYLKEGNFEGIKFIGHGLKGTGSGYGLDFISELGYELESKALELNAEKLNEYIEDLSYFLENVEVIYVEE